VRGASMLLYIAVAVLGLFLFYYLVLRNVKPRKHESSASASGGDGGGDSKKAVVFKKIRDKYKSIEEVQEMLQKAGLESSNLCVGIDYTKSNEYTGKRTFGGQSLHFLGGPVPNPYQVAISVLGRTLEPFDEDHLIPVFGFGDVTTKDTGVFPFFPDSRHCRGFNEVLLRYTEITPGVKLSGPTSFAPIIHQAISSVRATRSYHILVIVADGQVTNPKATVDAIVEASSYPISIVLVGVGDGPCDAMKEFDDGLPKRKFDNFQFVELHAVMADSEYPEASFAIAALQEIPAQFKAIKRLGYV